MRNVLSLVNNQQRLFRVDRNRLPQLLHLAVHNTGHALQVLTQYREACDHFDKTEFARFAPGADKEMGSVYDEALAAIVNVENHA